MVEVKLDCSTFYPSPIHLAYLLLPHYLPFHSILSIDHLFFHMPVTLIKHESLLWEYWVLYHLLLVFRFNLLIRKGEDLVFELLTQSLEGGNPVLLIHLYKAFIVELLFEDLFHLGH